MARPDFEVKIKAQGSKYGTRVGAAWRTKDGRGVNIVLDAGVSVATPEGVFLTLWPAESREEREARLGPRDDRRGQAAVHSRSPQPDDVGFGDDDVPF